MEEDPAVQRGSIVTPALQNEASSPWTDAPEFLCRPPSSTTRSTRSVFEFGQVGGRFIVLIIPNLTVQVCGILVQLNFAKESERVESSHRADRRGERAYELLNIWPAARGPRPSHRRDVANLMSPILLHL